MIAGEIPSFSTIVEHHPSMQFLSLRRLQDFIGCFLKTAKSEEQRRRKLRSFGAFSFALGNRSAANEAAL